MFCRNVNNVELEVQESETEYSENEGRSFDAENRSLVKCIGTGFYGAIWLAKYKHRDIIIKNLNGLYVGMFVNENRLDEDILKEVETLQSKNSTHIVEILNYNASKKWVMSEYCENGSLLDMFKNKSKHHVLIEWSNRLKWLTAIAEGVNILHNQPPTVLHRDIKSSNIFLDEHYEAKIGDFGLTKLAINLFDPPSIYSFSDRKLLWQPPEVICSGKYSTKSDVYSFGVVMYELLTLDAPYGLHVVDDEDNTKGENFVKSWEGFYVPEDRSELPGIWHPCLEDYVDIMNHCVIQNPDKRIDFVQISRRLNEISNQYDKYVLN